MSKSAKGILFLCVSVLLYSVMPVLIRFLGSLTIPPATQVFLRYIVAFIAAAVYFFISKTRFSIKPQDRVLFILVALFGYALTNLFYTYGILLTQVGTVLFIFFCSSIMTPILGYVFLKEKIHRTTVIALVLSFIALLFLFRPGPIATWRLGAIFALLSAIGQSFYVIGRKKLGGYSSTLVLLLNTFVGVVALGAISLVTEQHFYAGGAITSLKPMAWLVVVLFGLDNFAAWLFMTKGFQLIEASTGSLVMLTENPLGIFFAFLFFGEVPTAATFFGGALILTAAAMVLMKHRRGSS